MTRKNKIGTIRDAINNEKSLKISNQLLKVKEKDEYLGEILHESGLRMSVRKTIDKRYGKIFTSIIEFSSILQDYRIDTLGGMKAGLDIIELALIPSLLHNADRWFDINFVAENKLESIQNTMFRYLFGVPLITPKPILRFDFGHLTMREKVHIRKLNLLHHLKNLPSDSLGSEFYQLQAKLHLPGLIKECRTLIRMYNLPDIIDGQQNFPKEKWKKLVKRAVRDVSELNAKKEFEATPN